MTESEIRKLMDTFIREIELLEKVLSDTSIWAQELQEEIERIQRATIGDHNDIPMIVDDMRAFHIRKLIKQFHGGAQTTSKHRQDNQADQLLLYVLLVRISSM